MELEGEIKDKDHLFQQVAHRTGGWYRVAGAGRSRESSGGRRAATSCSRCSALVSAPPFAAALLLLEMVPGEGICTSDIFQPVLKQSQKQLLGRQREL